MDENMEAVVFAGSALAPFFLEDPRTGAAATAFEALRALDVADGGEEWPFVDASEASACLALMQEGLADGVGDDALVWEYRRQFVGPGHFPAPPWGSVYTDRECVIFGESTLALRAWMRGHGIQRTTDERTPEDHIGLMLAMLAFLAQERPELVDEYLCGHLLTWAPHYLETLEEATEHPFYQGLARLTRATLLGLQKDRELTVELPRFYR
ncbi:Tat proofreading chaperone DmsD [Adlercreutzia sp. R21]|uniref:Tat proofreading chaperone DmsD n=1 Tax=Adlercreutzia wanghongyangiae TaxID=3111451 RepID=UPI002DB8C200|nr:Tat proofreading chaperone DmsD [Adlercreutzia sp. R21]MEC4183618.1 Tat proofreading chaperone DmsD [Adlercreutzia sp. R21]